MRQRFFILFLSIMVNHLALAQNKVDLPTRFIEPIQTEVKPFFSLSEGQLSDLLKGEVISQGKVKTPAPKKQELALFVVGIHPRNCTRAMRKLALYENYHQYMDFIKSSTYDEKNQKFSFVVDHTLLPFAMIVKFKIPRIKGEGHYPFIFEDGFLKDLKGTVIVSDQDKHCLLALKADWNGPETVIPNIIFGTFLETVGKLGLEHLIRVSLF
jgi:hypothetical protein